MGTFPCGKESACNAGDLGLIPGLGRSLGGGNGYPLQYSGLENSKDCMVHGVAKSRTQLSNFHYAPYIYLRRHQQQTKCYNEIFPENSKFCKEEQTEVENGWQGDRRKQVYYLIKGCLSIVIK